MRYQLRAWKIPDRGGLTAQWYEDLTDAQQREQQLRREGYCTWIDCPSDRTNCSVIYPRPIAYGEWPRFPT